MKFIIDEEKCRIDMLLTKRTDLKSDFFKHTFPTYKAHPTLSDIDEELHPLILSMWQKGYKTLQCCAGHGKLGFIIYRPYRHKKWRMVGWQPEIKIPQSINDLVIRDDFTIEEFTVQIKVSKDKLKELIKYSQCREGLSST